MYAIFSKLVFTVVCIGIIGCDGGKNGDGESSSDDETDGSDSETDESDSETTTTDTETTSESESASESDADAVWAHVRAVTATGSAGEYTLSVTVESGDIGCEQYADWWEVLSPEGDLIYRRILLHSHTDANGNGNPFTRTGGPVSINADTQVIVRAHMNTVGYHGAAMRGTVQNGFLDAPDIDASFAADVEQLDPLPESCAF